MKQRGHRAPPSSGSKRRTPEKWYRKEIVEETRKIQGVLWMIVGISTLLYGFAVLFWYPRQEALWRYLISCFLFSAYAALAAWLCRRGFQKNVRWLSAFLYANVAIILLTIEWQYTCCPAYMNYTLYLCMFMATSLMVIGPTWRYAVIVVTVLGLNAWYVVHFCQPGALMPYVVDVVITVMTTVAINRCLYLTKGKEIESRAHLRLQRDTDGMSKLLTRRAAERLIRSTETADGLCAMLILDVDNFKAVNDTYGHMRGDEVIRRVADILRGVFRREDCLARLGGDEFLVFLRGISQTVVLERLERLMSAFKITGRNEQIGITCSVGVAFARVGELGENLFEFMYRTADAKLYEAKKKGKNQYCS